MTVRKSVTFAFVNNESGLSLTRPVRLTPAEYLEMHDGTLYFSRSMRLTMSQRDEPISDVDNCLPAASTKC